MNKKVGIITQARMTSTRLPGKILMQVNGKSLLQYHVERLQQAKADILIATTSNATDQPVQVFADSHQLICTRGSEANVLSRFYEAATAHQLAVIVRVTSDCPLIDPGLIQSGIELYLQKNDPNLYLSNCIERSYARGFDFEIFSYALLKEAYENATEEPDKEHVTPYIWKNRSGKVNFFHVKQAQDHSGLRITVDTPADFELIKTLISDHKAETLSAQQIEQLLLAHPELVALNADIEQKKV